MTVSGSFESTVAFEPVPLDHEDWATNVDIYGQFENAINTSDTFNNTSENTSEESETVKPVNEPVNDNSNGHSDVEYELLESEGEDDGDDEDDNNGFGTSINVLEQIAELSDPAGSLSLDDSVHDDFTNGSLDNRDNSFLEKSGTNGGKSGGSTVAH